jgi:hypothetical protein
MNLFIELKIKDSFGKKFKNFLTEIKGDSKEMKQIVLDLGVKVNDLAAALLAAAAREDARHTADLDHVKELEGLLAAVNAENAQTDVDLTPIAARVSALVDSQNARLKETETPSTTGETTGAPATGETAPSPATGAADNTSTLPAATDNATAPTGAAASTDAPATASTDAPTTDDAPAATNNVTI